MKTKQIIIILLAIVSIYLCYYFIGIDFNKKKENPKSESKEELDLAIKDQINEKIDNLEGADICSVVDTYDYENGCLYQKDNVQAEELDFIYKLYTLILNHRSDFNLKEEEIIFNQNKYLIEGSISEDQIKKQYHKLYGNNEPFSAKVVNTLPDQSRIIFDEQKNLFYLKKKKSKNKIIKKYIYNYNQKQNEIYVDVAVAFIRLIGIDEYTNYEAYHEKEMITLKAEGIYKEMEEFKINKDNYHNYSHYQYKFIKMPDNSYQFVEVNKMK